MRFDSFRSKGFPSSFSTAKGRRDPMQSIFTASIFTLLLMWSFIGAAKQSGAEKRLPDLSSTNARIAHGRYLVHDVAKCIECHTPRDAQGELIESRWLAGAPVPVAGPKFAMPWAAQSASIAGLRNYDEVFIRHLLVHGVRPDGSRPNSPMPQFQLDTEDANSVIAYLRSL